MSDTQEQIAEGLARMEGELETTQERLAGFEDRVYDRFDQVDDRFDNIDDRFRPHRQHPRQADPAEPGPVNDWGPTTRADPHREQVRPPTPTPLVISWRSTTSVDWRRVGAGE